MQVFMKTSVPRHVPVSLYMAFYFACLQKHPNDTKALARYLSTESINAIQTYPNTFLTAICPSIKFSHSRRRSWYVCVGGSFTILRARGRHGRALLSYIFFYSLSYFLKLQSIFFFFFWHTRVITDCSDLVACLLANFTCICLCSALTVRWIDISGKLFMHSYKVTDNCEAS